MILVLKNKVLHLLYLLLFMLVFNACGTQVKDEDSQDLYTGFKNPPAEARPFVRWWWNGNKVKAEELDRELELLKNVGFGGVEINPIAMPVAPDTDTESLVWMSDEWIDMVVHACKKTKDLGMIADIIAGTGWPFGGEFLKDNETSQRMVSDNIVYKHGSKIEIDEAQLIQKYKQKHKNNRSQRHISKNTSYKLSYAKLVPNNCSDTQQIIDLKNHTDVNGKITYQIPQKGSYFLSYGLVQQNFREVTLGAPGGAGPVMDHYKKEMTLAYLNRMKKISERSGMPLSDLIRAIFCDSIEVSGANWTDGFENLFWQAYGYRLNDWMPFIFYQSTGTYSQDRYVENFTDEFKDKLKRVRYDYNKLLVEVFLKNFTQTYKDFCEENNILCRYQAYGTPFLMGMLDGYMILDIPESNNWIYTVEMKDETWDWNQSHGYMIWNMYAAAGAHLSGKKITSCESMTNLRGVFKATLEEIKQHDDMNFITGINHSVLHGYNYSPPEVPFPGWIRYGAYFSEQNTWWKHLPKWIDYNARLSYVFQNSQANKSIAILGPTADIWGDKGLARTPFHMEPEYLYRLWEPISQLGYSAEYINQGILERAKMNEGKITYGNMSYKLLILASLKSLSPKAAANIKAFVEAGGKIVVIDKLPTKSLHFTDFEANDALVNNTITGALNKYPEAFIQVEEPKSLDDLFNWTRDILKASKLEPDVAISNPTKNVYQIHQYTDDKVIYFFTNINRAKTITFNAIFPVEDKYPYLWNPETGTKTPYYFQSNSNELSISLNPLESLLLVFEDDIPKQKVKPVDLKIEASKILDVNWQVIGNRKDSKTFTWNMSTLYDFSKSNDSTQNTFGGNLIYKTTIDITESFTHIDLGNVNEGITTLFINGEKVGERWYGKAIYPIEKYLNKGENNIEIHYTTVLANYAKSLKKNKMAYEWTKRYKDLVPTGIEGPVTLFKY
ncbi:glycosyl hydrolase [Jejuia pallidilutea]|uniref:Glycoside hydrolase family 2 n=1 Tax=Jejuia pallidilutea TaxID=504487 RepID=A0A090WIB4_9FLAO|nr:glycosyl hydrolase [Jejuia pallidilutea]GAL67232.1 glycoside hydrolase family 2 [Jejuia pallidilutea]GAL70871.1 glycoside hydrolase family 2 sugar binding [Jejuia pallidilutea]GAL89776.1 glycoside hydrolase family 2 sugar binding [Jejuia pallidilutea]